MMREWRYTRRDSSVRSVGNGPKRAAVTYDGAHYVVLGGNWLSGLWRYVEP